MSSRYGDLLLHTSEEILGALGDLGKKSHFGKLFRSYQSNLSYNTLAHFLSMTIGTHIGDEQRFKTMNQVGQFWKGLKTHCNEASEIVERFASDWFSKHFVAVHAI